MAERIILSFCCDDQPGIVAAVTSHFAERQFNIVESAQYQDPASEQFFMRTEYHTPSANGSLDDVRKDFAGLGLGFGMDWEIVDAEARLRILIGVSKWGHCLNKLLNAWRTGSLPVDIVGVFSNHDDMRSICAWYGVDYHHLPVSNETKPAQEQQILDLFRDCSADLIVLARYMQILSDDLCTQVAGKAINIHHSFLPGFKGARPYHQAFEKGVKLIGATAHYVTADLDEGPIIDQSVVRVSHAQQPGDLVEIGRDVEAVVLNNAVKWHAEQRVMRNGKKTVVFNQQ